MNGFTKTEVANTKMLPCDIAFPVFHLSRASRLAGQDLYTAKDLLVSCSNEIKSSFIPAVTRQNILCFFFVFMTPPFSIGGHIVSPLSVRTSVRPVRPVRNTFGFRAISFERLVYWIQILYTGIKS